MCLLGTLFPPLPTAGSEQDANTVRAQIEAQSPASGPPEGITSLPYGGSRQVSLMSSVSRAYSLLCRYLLEEVRTRMETEDEEVRATVTVRLEGFLRHPPPESRVGPLFRHLTARGGG